MRNRALFVWSSVFFCAGCAAGAIFSPSGFIFLLGLAIFVILAIFLPPERRIIALLPLIFALGCFYTSLYGSFSKQGTTEKELIILRPLVYAKEELSANLKENLSPASSALALGILFGDRSGFSPEFRRNLIKSGTSHIVALSGFNITIVAYFIGSLFFFLPIKWRPFASALGIAIFVGVVGPSASVVRAAIMGSLILFAKNAGRLVDMKGPISFAAVLMVAINPLIITNDAGFILSFSALLGIIYIAPYLKKLLFKDENIGFFKSIPIECFSAGIAVAPAVTILFGSFNWLSFIPNIMIIWTVPLAMAFSFASGIISFISSPLSFPFAVVAEAILSYEIWIINFFARGF